MLLNADIDLFSTPKTLCRRVIRLYKKLMDDRLRKILSDNFKLTAFVPIVEFSSVMSNLESIFLISST